MCFVIYKFLLKPLTISIYSEYPIFRDFCDSKKSTKLNSLVKQILKHFKGKI